MLVRQNQIKPQVLITKICKYRGIIQKSKIIWPEVTVNAIFCILYPEVQTYPKMWNLIIKASRHVQPLQGLLNLYLLRLFEKDFFMTRRQGVFFSKIFASD